MSDRLKEFKAQEYQDAALTCAAPVQILRGGNRSAKSTVAAAKVALAVRPMVPLHLSGGLQIMNADHTPLRILLVGRDREHVRDTLYPILFEGIPGSVDERPFIPQTEVADYSWISKSHKVPEAILLKSGTQIHFAASVFRDGPKFDIVWLDERPQNDSDVENMIGRSKLFIWSTWPTAVCEPLRKLSAAASPFGSIREFRFRFSDNKAIDEKLAEQTRERWEAFGNGEIEARDLGEFPAEESLRCVAPDCGNLVEEGDRMCEAHRALHTAMNHPAGADMRFERNQP